MNLVEREQRILRLLEELKQGRRYARWLIARASGRLFLLNVKEIIWIQAQGNYVRVHHERGSYLLRETVSGIQAQLDPRRFLRVHRSAIVQIDRIKELHPWFHGEYRLILQNGTQLTLTRNYRSHLQNAIGKQI